MSITSQQHSTRSSVYQTDLNKPLSQEALYKAKLKYGIYEKPSQPTLGVPSSANASDTAALLAASSDLSIKPYQRDVAADAQTAALFAKAASITPYRREVSDDAHLASLSAVSKKSKISFVDSAKDSPASPSLSSSSAAASALKTKKSNGSISTQATNDSYQKAAAASLSSKNSRGIGSLASESLASLYEFDAIRNGTIKNSTNLNLSKITEASKAKADKALNERWNPALDSSRSGIITESKLTDEQLADFAGSAALAMKDFEAPVDPDLEAKSVYRNSLVDPKVLALASLNADSTLKSIDSDLTSRNLFLNPEFNKAALAIAQKKYEETSVNTGKVNLGGGLYMTPDELQTIAKKFVDPVLDTIDKQTTLQREQDAKDAAEKKAREDAHQKSKQAHIDAKLKAKKQKEDEKLQRRRELDEEKAKQVQAKKDLEDLKKEELAKQQEILELKQTEETRKKEELLAKKQEEEERIAKEAKEAQDARDAELEESKKDRDEKLAPILAELQQETDKLNLLSDEKKGLEDIASSHLAKLTNAKQLLTTSETEITHLEESFKTLQVDIENSTSEQEKLTKEAEAKKVEAELSQQKLKQVESEVLVKNLEIEKLKNETLEKKLALQLKLEEEKIKALHEEKQIIETLPPHLKPKVETPEVKSTSTAVKKPVTTAAAAPVKEAKKATPRPYSSLFDAVKSKLSSKSSIAATSAASNKSIVNASGAITPETGVSTSKKVEPVKTEPEPTKSTTNKHDEELVDGGEIKQTFSGFTQGSNEEADEVSRSKGGYFKEEF